jgi:hypothetical protein
MRITALIAMLALATVAACSKPAPEPEPMPAVTEEPVSNGKYGA